MHTRWARFVRGWIVAAVSTFVAALSHTLGGGSVPGPLAVVVSLAFAGMICGVAHAASWATRLRARRLTMTQPDHFRPPHCRVAAA